MDKFRSKKRDWEMSMIKRVPPAETQLSAEETARIIDEMDRLLNEMKEAMGTIKKLIETEPVPRGAGTYERV